MTKYSVKQAALFIALFFSFLVGFTFVGSSEAMAINGATTNVFPDTSTNGVPTYTVVQLRTGGQQIRARSTLANVYVPTSMRGQNISLAIVNGCNNSGPDINGWVANTIFYMDLPWLGVSRTTASDCSGGNINLTFQSPGGGSPRTVTDATGTYDVYRFKADAYGTETTQYLNAFQVWGVNAGIYLGPADTSSPCDSANYNNSCPSPHPGGLGRIVYSSYYNRGNPFGANYGQTLSFATGSCAINARISLYDLDANDTGLGQTSITMELRANGVLIASLNHSQIQNWAFAHPGYGGNENEYLDLPSGGNFTMAANTTYTMTVNGLSYNNAFQMGILTFDQGGCGPPPSCSITSITNTGGGTTIYPGQQLVFTVSAQNTAGYLLGVNGPNWGPPGNFSNYLVTGSQYIRSPLPSPSASNFLVSLYSFADGGPFNQAIYAPGSPGTFPFNWGLVIPGTSWQAVTCAGSVTVTAPPPADAASCVSSTVLTSNITTGSAFQVRLRFRNNGTNTWTPGTWNLGSRWDQTNNFRTNGGGEIRNGTVPFNVGPGGEFDIVLSDTAPLAPGTYSYQWRMVHEGFAWFGEPCGPLITVIQSDRAATGNILVANCTTISGIATDADWAAGNLRVHIRFDDRDKAVYDAEVFTNAAGAWSLATPAGYRDASPHNVYISIRGKDSAGVEINQWSGYWTGIASRAFGPCDIAPTGSIQTANCSTVSGIASDVNWPAGGLRVHIRFDDRDKPFRDIEVFTNGAGQWSAAVPAAYVDFSAHNVYMAVQSKDSAGADTGLWVGYWSGIAFRSFGPCDRLPTGSISTDSDDTNCRRISGNIRDADWSNGGLRVHIRFDNSGTPLAGEVFTDDDGDWSWTIPAGYKTDAARSIWISVQGKDSAGVETDWQTTIANNGFTVGPCKNSACANISYRLGSSGGYVFIPNGSTIAVPRGSDLQTQYEIENTAPDNGGAEWTSYGNNANQYAFGYENGNPGSGTANTLDTNTAVRRLTPSSGDVPTEPDDTVIFRTNNDTTSFAIGAYVLRLRMMQNTVGYFGATCTINVTLTNPPPSCGPISYSTTDPQIGDSFTATLGVINPATGSTYGASSHRIRATFFGLGITNQDYALNGGSLVPGTTGTANTGLLSPVNAGEYRIVWALVRIADGAVISDGDATTPGNQYCVSSGTNSAGGGGPSAGGGGPNGGGDGSDLRVVTKPYYKFLGGDVVAGSMMEDATNTCVAPSSTGKIYGFAVAAPAGGYAYGSSGELAIFALNEINQVYSASDFAPFPAVADNYRLNFSNLDLNSNSRYQSSAMLTGRYGASLGCIPNYYNRFRTPSASTDLGNNTVINPNTSFTATGQYHATGNVTLDVGGVAGTYTTPLGRRIALFVDGNVSINSNIHYANYGTISDIPSMWIIATGNIYIDNDVTQIEGVLSATGTGTNQGTLYTCASGFSPILETNTTAGSELWASCNRRFNVNGGVSAKRIKMSRVYKSLNCARPGADITAIAAACPGSLNPAPLVETPAWMSAAEVYKSLAEVMIVTPPFNASYGQAYERITSLPPIY